MSSAFRSKRRRYWVTLLFAGVQSLAVAVTPAQSVTSKGGPGSLAGVWVKADEPFGNTDRRESLDDRKHVLTTADGSPLPARPEAMKEIEKRLSEAEAGHPFASPKTQCLPPGVPDMMFGFGPFQILETPGQVTILRQEFTFFRIIKLNRAHAEDPDPSFLGDSVGHWEGDTFVVDTIGLTDRTTVKFILPHSDALHVVERYRRTGPDTMDIVGTIDDPKTYTRPWTMITHLKRLTGGLKEYFCENNRNQPDASGHIGVQMPAPSQR